MVTKTQEEKRALQGEFYQVLNNRLSQLHMSFFRENKKQEEFSGCSHNWHNLITISNDFTIQDNHGPISLMNLVNHKP